MGAYETKVIIKQMTEIVARAESLEDAYNAIANSEREEGISLPTYEEKRREIKKSSEREV